MKKLFWLLFAGMMSMSSSAADTDEGYVIDSFWTTVGVYMLIWHIR